MLTADVRVGIYECMHRIHGTDKAIRDLMMSGKIAIIYYSARGQEAIPAALSASLTADDYITTTYRGMHDTIAKGAPLREVVAEIFGRVTGSCKGKGGIMHLADPRSGVMATSGIVGGALPIANGLALRSQMTGSDAVTVSYFGDGATNIGAFHESLNMAAVWRLPVVFVCQNNEYGEYTPRMESMLVEEISVRATAYGMPGVTVNGNDPDEMFVVGSEAIARARAGEGPTLIEAKTYRFMGHIVGLDQMIYMPAEEMAAAKAKDPIPAYRQRLIDSGAISADDLIALEAKVEAEVADAIQFALDSAVPGLEETTRDVYAYEVAR